ncbi:MAG: hypothetical protein PUE68_11125 [Kiritimatiellae bacterium]|nr:hypothetical protein [Kiritimatiellia bacterium]
MKHRIPFFSLAAGVALGAVAGPAVSLSFDSPEAFLRDAGTSGTVFRHHGEVQFDEDGVKGGCAFFDGGSWLEAETFPAALKTGGAPYTVSAWIRVAAEAHRNAGWVSWGDKATGCGNSLRLNGPDEIHNYWNNRDLTVRAEGVADGRWHYVTATFDGRVRTVYMDGVPCGANEQRPDIGRTLFQVGRTMHDAAFKGWVDELAVENAAVDAATAFERYRAAITPRALTRLKPVPPPKTLRATTVPAPSEKLLKDGFSVRLEVDLGAVRADEALGSFGPVRFGLRLAGRDKAHLRYDRAAGNYLGFPMPDGTCPVIEAVVDAKAGRVGIPLGVLDSSRKVHDVVLRWAPPRWEITVDGHVDEDFPMPAPAPFAWKGDQNLRIHSPRVSAEVVEVGAVWTPPAVPAAKPIEKPIQYWTPAGHNQWVGDVAPAFLNGRLHVFYLIDRRHHGSGAGTGRHQFAHLSSDDLVHWQEHPLAVPVREWWQTCGTGTPFLKDGKLAIAFGWHTSRYGAPAKDFPIGGTYASAADGIHFTNAGVMVSEAQNPSIYNLPDGRYELVTSYGGSIGIFHSKDLLKWDLFDAKLPFRGDCPSLFDWHGHRYLLQGFVNMAYSPDGTPGSFVNWSQEPDKLYDGLGVPMVASWKGDRRLYLGWLNHVYGWGGWLVFREVVYYPDGHLGLKWVPEIPLPVPPRTYPVAAGARFTRRFRPQGRGAALVLTIDPAARTASFGDDVPDLKFGEARSGENVRIGGVRGLDADYAVKLVVYYDAKADVTIFDAEVAGQRTLICRRAGRFDEAE